MTLAADQLRDRIIVLRTLFEQRYRQFRQTGLAHSRMTLLGLANQRPEPVMKIDREPEVHEACRAVISGALAARLGLVDLTSRPGGSRRDRRLVPSTGSGSGHLVATRYQSNGLPVQ